MSDYIRDDRLAAEGGIAQTLKRAREAAGLTGKELAAASGLQPARISRIESGKVPPRANELAAWAQATNLDSEATNRLTALLASYNDQQAEIEERIRYGQVGADQEQAKLLEEAKVIYGFATASLPNYLQIPEYARQLIKPMAETWLQGEVDAAVRTREVMSDLLNDQQRRFRIVIAESALRWLLADPDVLRAQIGRLYALISMPNVEFGILPFSRRLHIAPRHAFTVYDSRLVVVETFAGDERRRGQEPKAYLQAMDQLWSQSVQGADTRDLLLSAVATVPGS